MSPLQLQKCIQCVFGSKVSFLVLAALLFHLSNPALAANKTAASLGGTEYVLSDGNFESPALSTSPGYAYNPAGTNWNFSGGAGFSRNGTGFTSGNPNAPQGAQVLFLQGTGGITQSIDFVAGYYTFDFYAAQRGNHQASSQTIALKVDGQTIQSFSPSGTNYQRMTSNRIFIASGSHSIQLFGTNPNGGDNTAFIDNFRAKRLITIPLSGFESPALPNSPGYQYSPNSGAWTFTQGAGLSRSNTAFTSGNPPSPEGNQVCFLQSPGRATRQISIDGNGFYRFRFKAALRGNNQQDGEVKNVGLLIDGQEVGKFALPSSNYTEMVSLAIYLPQGSHTLQFQGANPVAGDHTGFVDDLRLEMVHDWHDGYVWGGSKPNANDKAIVGSNSAVALSGTVNPNNIEVMGHLLGAQNKDVNVSTKNIMVMGANSLLEFGQDLAPYTKNANFTLTANSNDPDVMNMGNNFIGAMNSGTIHFHGNEKKSWTQLGANTGNNASQITLKEAVNWSVNDEILIVSSRKSWNEAEKRTITSISGGGTIIELNAALAYPHTGVQKTYTEGNRSWTADLRAQVGLLSHNIKVEGNATAAATGFGGHIMIMNNSKAYVSGIELYNMGQKAELGRYPFHWHMLGDVGEGQYIKRSSIHQSYNRAITIHGTESTLVEDNFCYDHIGHGVFLEDGSERFNVIKRNVVLLSKRPAPGEEVTPSDNQFNEVQNRTPSSFWITNPQNTFEDNVAAGTHGTGFWFAFPTKPMGPSATDPRFSSLKPHELPLISFKGNMAHSCMSGFDIFDQLDATHTIVKNKGWNESSMHYIDECTWYANDLAIYSGIGGGGPVTNLIWRDNIFVENKVGSMLASYSIIEGSVFAANSGENLYSSNATRYAYRAYDGAGSVLNSHFVGWNASNASFLLNTGAATKHPNSTLNGNTMNHSGTVRCVLPNFDVPPGYAGANDPEHPRFWSVVFKDIDGGISGKANTSIVCNHPFVLIGDEYQPSNWTRTYRSDHHFVLSRLTYDLPSSQHPNITATRTKTGTPTESVYYIDGFKEHHQLPFIVNEDFEYTYTYETLPSSKRVRMYMDDATAGDDYLARFKDFGKLGGLSIGSTQGGITSHSSLASLNSANSSGYYRQTNGDLYIKAVATGKVQRFDISWSTNFAVPKLDTDGDEMADATEITNGRHPFTANDLASEFNQNGDYESWTGSANISGKTVSGGSFKGTSINNGDAMIINNAFNFNSDEVPFIKVRMKCNQNTASEFFFATSTAAGFSGTRRVSSSYTGNGAWQTLTFNMNGHSAWNNTITDLRFDVVSGVGKTFEIDWIRASQTSKSGGSDDFTVNSAIGISPNPFGDQLNIQLPSGNQFHTLRLVDVQGRVLRESKVTEDLHQLNWDFANAPIPSGIYFVQFLGEYERKQMKVLKQ